MDVFWVEGQTAAFAHLIDPLVFGVGVSELDQGIAYLHMVILIGAHEAGQHNLAGQAAGFLQRRGFRWQDIRPVLNELGQQIDET